MIKKTNAPDFYMHKNAGGFYMHKNAGSKRK